MKLVHARFVACIIASVLVLAGCSGARNEAFPQSRISGVSAAPTTTASTPESSRSESSQREDDLKTGRRERTLKSGDLTVTAEYSTNLETHRWTPAVRKPLEVTLTALVNGNREQRVYLSGVTIYLAPSDASGPFGSPDPLRDTADITPGYVVTFPETYNQSFSLPAVDEGANTLRVDLRFEFLLLQGTTSPRDFSKRTATDSLTIPLS